MTPTAWAAESARATCSTTRAASRGGSGPSPNISLRRLAGDQLHHQIRQLLTHTGIDGADIEDGNHIGMLQPRHRERFPLEARLRRRFGDQNSRQELEGHLAVETLVPRRPHGPHSASSEPTLEAKPPDPHSGLEFLHAARTIIRCRESGHNARSITRRVRSSARGAPPTHAVNASMTHPVRRLPS